MFRRFAVLGALFAIAFASQPAAAAPGGNEVLIGRVVVPYADLDMKTPAGRAALQARLASAAALACGGSPAFHPQYRAASRFVRSDFHRCQADAELGALIELKHRGVTMMAQSR